LLGFSIFGAYRRCYPILLKQRIVH
jgi:hypothetical protein